MHETHRQASHIRRALGISTDSVGWDKEPRATFKLSTIKAAAPAEANCLWARAGVRVWYRCPNASSSKDKYRSPKRRRKPVIFLEKHV